MVENSFIPSGGYEEPNCVKCLVLGWMHVENWDRWDLFLFIRIWHNACHRLQRNMEELR